MSARYVQILFEEVTKNEERTLCNLLRAFFRANGEPAEITEEERDMKFKNIYISESVLKNLNRVF